MPHEERQPFFFGDGGSLFGCHHAPREPAPRAPAVLLCAPSGKEYLRSHRALVQLASRLARRGVPVLRFDYYGSGDSAGETTEATLERWTADTGQALDALASRSRGRGLCVVGLRLGATLASLAVEQTAHPVHHLVLWDAVIDGPAFLAELEQAQGAMLSHAYVSPREATLGSGGAEVLGFPLGAELERELKELDLTRLRLPERHVCFVQGEEDPRVEAWRGALASAGTRVDDQVIPGPRVWTEDPYKGIVPHGVLEGIQRWIVEIAV